jgi:hypothetical protein
MKTNQLLITDQSKLNYFLERSLIHIPSLAIGSGIASVVIIIIFVILNTNNHQDELALVPTPEIQGADHPKITIDT